MKTRTTCTLLAALLVASPLSAQMDHGDNSMSLAAIKGLHETVSGFITAAAEQMPESEYSFAPTPEVRTFGQMVGHVANASAMFCAGAMGVQPEQRPDAEKLMSKDAIVSALKSSIQYCDAAYGMDPMKVDEEVSFFGQKHTRLSVLAFNMGHNFEHYGNLVTYLRMKGMVPPSSQGGM